MKLLHPLSLSLSLLLAGLAHAGAQSADDFFHNGAVNYLSNNIPKALDVVTNGRALYPDDIKLKKLEELLKQQNQQQQQQQKDEQQKKQDEKKEQQSKQDQKDEQQQSKEDQQKQDQPQQSKSKPEEKQEKEQQPATAHAMTPQEAKQLLDAQKGDEKVLQFVPQGEPKNRSKTLRDW